MAKKNVIKDKYANREAEKYARPIASREYILDLLQGSDTPLSLAKIGKALGIDHPDDCEALRRRLIAMLRDGQIIQNRRGAYGVPSRMDLMAGRVIAHRDGFGFLEPDEGGEDLYLHARQMRQVFHNDRVLASVVGVDHRGRREAAIVEVTERNTHEMAGRLIEEAGVGFVQPVNTRFTQPVLIPSANRHGAENGQMVMVRIVSWPGSNVHAVGEVSEILGDHMAPGMEIDLAIRNHELPHVWPDEVLKEAAAFSETVSDTAKAGRLDLRHLPFVTIDGEDAKDFDDAVYAEETSQGWTLYVAIADVSYYVRPGSALDIEALNRGNSVYFPEQVIPMLPEALSNGLCSLNPHVDRLAMVCIMQVDRSGNITDYQFHEAVFFSHARLTYNKVSAMLTGEERALRQEYAPLLKHLESLYALYKQLAAARKKRGSIDFDFPETRIVFGSDRKIERIVQLVRNDAHRLIEECMLCANISAARFLEKNKCAGLYRVHRGPSPEKLLDLRKFLNELALTLPGGEQPAPRDYATLLASIAERPDLNMIQTVLLRSLSQALYSPDNEGHFSLAFEAYTHFTSPIRRYPDLLVHRAIRGILRGEFSPDTQKTAWQKWGEHCSMTERRADDATREAIDWLKCEYMLDKVGEEFEGVVSSVMSFGMFVQLKDIFVEGLIHISQLPNDYYHFDSLRHEIVGEHSGTRYRLGMPVRVKVARVDLDQRQMDFVLSEEGVDTLPLRRAKKSHARLKKIPKKKSRGRKRARE